MAKRRKPNLEEMSDDAQAALDALFVIGYEKEVVAIRNFIAAMGEGHREQMKIQFRIAADLAKGRPIRDAEAAAAIP